MSNRDPEVRYTRPEQVIPWSTRQIINQHVHTAIPGIVDRYEPETKRAEVQPAIVRLIAPEGSRGDDDPDDLEEMERPVILNVPVIHPTGGGFVVHIPLRRGDPVVLVFSERGIDIFKQTYRMARPPLESFFADRDAMAIPGFGALSITPASTSGLSIQTDDGQTAIVMTPGHVDIRSASLTHNGVNVGDTHSHGGIASGPGRTTGPG